MTKRPKVPPYDADPADGGPGLLLFLVIVLMLFIGFGAALAFGQESPSAAMERVATAAKTTGCSRTIQRHVYHPDRLTVYSRCIAVTGTIVDATRGRRHDGVRKEADGDTHGWLKVDTKFRPLLNSGSRKQEGGNLVFEIVCFWKPTQADAKSSCLTSYHNAVQLPPVGSHVRIVGTYVVDDNHAHWTELHPVSKIEVLR